MIDLKDVILNVLRLAGPRGVNRTMLVKLVYFTELEGWRRFGQPVTATPFRLYHYGAWAPEVVYVAEQEDAVRHSFFHGFHLEHNYSLGTEVAVPPLPSEVEQLIRDVFESYSRKSAAEVGALSKQTEPMANAKPGDRLDLSVVAPRVPQLRVKNAKLASALADHDFSRRGTRSELDARDTDEVAAWSPARRRAARV